MHEAYQPIIEDGRGIFPEDFRVKAPRGFNDAVRLAARRQHMTRAEYARRALLRILEGDGVHLRRGSVSAIFSIAPLLLISIYLASFFLDRSAAVEGLSNEMIGVIGPSGSDAIKEMLDASGTAQPEGWAGLVAIAVLLFAATGLGANSVPGRAVFANRPERGPPR